MNSEWQEYELSEAVELISDKVDIKEVNVNEFISTENLLQNLGGIEKSSGLPKNGKVTAFTKGDVLFSNIRPYFRKVWQASFSGACSNDVIVFRGKKLENDFLYYVIADNSFIDYATKTAKGTKMPRGDKNAINKYVINLPPLPEQKAIAHILGTLDEKIELNLQLNETLEQMAQALFESWFVDFDPVLDNVIAKGNTIPDTLKPKAEQRKEVMSFGKYKTLPKEIMELFPSSFEFNGELEKWIPEGWEVKSLYESAEFVNGAAFKSSDFSTEKGLPIIKIAELKNGISDQTKFTNKTIDSKYNISKEDLLYSWSGSPETSLNTFIWNGIDGLLNQHIFKVNVRNDEHKAFMFFLLHSLKPILVSIAKDKQTTGLGHVTVKDMKNLLLVYPRSNFNEIVSKGILPMFRKIISNNNQMETLIKQREVLLPQLIRGKLRISDKEMMITCNLK